MAYAAEDDQWPVCVDRMSGQGTDADVHAYNEQRLARLGRAEVHVQVIDAQRAATMSSSQRRAVARFNEDHAAAQRQWVAGVAFISGSPMARGILRAIYWLQPPPYPTAVFAAREPALSWALTRLQKKRLPS